TKQLPSLRTSELCEPWRGLRFGHYCQNLDGRAGHIVEDPNFVYPQPILWTEQSSQSLDATAARFLGLVTQMRFERSPDSRASICRQPPEVFDSFGSKDDLERHSGQIIARFAWGSNEANSLPWANVGAPWARPRLPLRAL